jgi:hypothetical protein
MAGEGSPRPRRRAQGARVRRGQIEIPREAAHPAARRESEARVAQAQIASRGLAGARGNTQPRHRNDGAKNFRSFDLNCELRRAVSSAARLSGRANHFLIRRARNPGMIKSTLMALIFLSAADIVMADGKYSDSTIRVATEVWYQFVGR